MADEIDEFRAEPTSVEGGSVCLGGGGGVDRVTGCSMVQFIMPIKSKPIAPSLHHQRKQTFLAIFTLISFLGLLFNFVFRHPLVL